MVDMALALKIAFGGFALVFILLILLSFTVWATKVVVEKIDKPKNE